MMSVETSETQKSMLEMEFHSFNNMIFYTNEYLVKKNDGDGNSGDANNQMMNQQQQAMSKHMSAVKNNFKIPKISK